MLKKPAWIVLVLATVFILFSACGKGKNNSQTSSVAAVKAPEIITIKKGDQVKLDSMENFIQVWILFNLEQKSWITEMEKNTNSTEDWDGILKSKREAFYQGFGLTEDDFNQYATVHNEEIQQFLEKNPDYKKAYDESM